MAREDLISRVHAAVKDYRTVFPEPNSLAPNLALAVEAVGGLEQMAHAILHQAQRADHAEDVLQARDRELAALKAALRGDDLDRLIEEALLGYAPGTKDPVHGGAWNARDDEIDIPAISARIRQGLLGGQG